jgi:hypothetical protein
LVLKWLFLTLKSVGCDINESGIISIGKKQGYLYYNGIGKLNSYHSLIDTIGRDSGDHFSASEILEAYERYNKENSPESLLEEAKRKYPVGTKFKCLHDCSRGPINNLSEIQLDNDGCIRWRNSKDIGAGCLYVESKWAEIIEPDCISKAREWVKITDFGRANGNDFTLNKPYQLYKDLNKINGFTACIDDGGNIFNGWDNAFELGMKFEKCEEPKFITKVNNQLTEEIFNNLDIH